MSELTSTLPIPVAAEKYCVDARRLRGAVFSNRNGDPLGDPATDLVQVDATLERWAQFAGRWVGGKQ